jgi:hypothetical protein
MLTSRAGQHFTYEPAACSYRKLLLMPGWLTRYIAAKIATMLSHSAQTAAARRNF